MTMVVIIKLLSGLGFIFIGSQFLTANMKQAVGDRVQSLIVRATGHPLASAVAGMAAGAVIQSTNAVTFIVISLVTAGVATVRQAMPIVTWSYAGSTLRLLLAAVDLGSVVMCGIAILGVLFVLGYDRDPRWRNLVLAMLGLGLLLHGVEVLTQASAPLGEMPAVKAFLGFGHVFYPWGFIAGTLLASVIQGQTVSVIAVALAAGGVLDVNQTFLIIVGSNLGAGIMIVVQGAALSGTARQLNLYQLTLKIIGVSIFLPALMLEHYAGVPLLRSFILSITADAALQVTALHWMFQLVSAAVASPLNGPLYALLERWSPPTTKERLGTPNYIGDLSGVQASVAGDMIAREQARLLSRLPHFLDSLRAEGELEDRSSEFGTKGNRPTRSELRAGGDELVAAIEKFVRSALDQPSLEKEHNRLLFLWSRCQVLRNLQSVMETLCKDLSVLSSSPLKEVANNIAEAVHAVMRVVEDEWNSSELQYPKLLHSIIAARAEAVKVLRQDILKRFPGASADERWALWSAIDQVGNLMWLLQQYGQEDSAAPA